MSDELNASKIEELSKLLATSTLPPFSIDLYGFPTETDARELGDLVGLFLRLFGTVLDLERLEAVTIAHDYDAALAAIETGTDGRTQLATRDGFAVGVAKAVTVLKDGVLKSHIVLHARIISQLRNGEDPNHQLAVGFLAHEAAHVHDLLMQDRAFPGVILRKRDLDFRDQLLLQIAHACWGEYAACRLSARWEHDKALEWFEDTFCFCAEEVRQRSNDHIRQYRRDAKVDTLVLKFVSEYGNALKYAAYLLGHLDGSGLSLSKDAPKAAELVNRKTYFTPIFESFAGCLRSMWETYGHWTGFGVFDPLKDVAEQLLKVGGIEIQARPEGQFYVDVPLTPETI